MSKKKKRMVWIFSGVVLLIALAAWLFVNMPAFGRLPRGERQARIERSPQYRNGQFRNLHETEMFTSDKGFFGNLADFLFRNHDGLRPEAPLPVVKTDLWALGRHRDVLVWFGHSSYLIQMQGRRILVDPVFCQASPVSFVNRPFAGPDVYTPADIPEVDYLIVTHDHWDHLDHGTVMALKDRIGTVICPLGVGEHFERWGFDPARIVEMDWDEHFSPADGWAIHCLPARHFSGRGLVRNRSLWASFLVESPGGRIYIGGDSGYDTHFAEIGQRFPDIDWAILENGQYNENWPYIHLLPRYMASAAKDLNARKILTVHHSKYALSTHPWDEPMANARRMRQVDSLDVVLPRIGEVVELAAAPDHALEH